KVYFPVAGLMSGLGMLNYIYSVIVSGSWRVTNMSTLMILSGVIVFLIGLLSEQLTNLQYKESDAGHD
ncbi:MAG: glycosyltransferase family 2 protein, partial [Gammaproteobacteria bacterium]|nr:glycosyltransferase family 2 protein [Gammaproteobacteria bacterium]